MKDYLELTKPRVTWLILMSTAVGFWFGVRESGDWWALLHVIAGTWFIASGTFTLNQWYERDADARMRRTKDRPLPTGRVTPRQALIFGLALSVIGFAELFWGANALTGWLGLFTEVSYLCAYTPLKQRSWHSTTVGAVPGAMPPLLGYAAAAGTLTWEAWTLYAILFLWQFPHFYAIAWMYREDYARADIKMLPVIEPDGAATARQILIASLILIPISLAPTYLSMAGKLYAVGATVLGIGFLYAGWKVARERTLIRARGVLLASVIYLPVLYGLMVLDRPGV
jgi:protoheme IX farnesyltransferase